METQRKTGDKDKMITQPICRYVNTMLPNHRFTTCIVPLSPGLAQRRPGMAEVVGGMLGPLYSAPPHPGGPKPLRQARRSDPQ